MIHYYSIIWIEKRSLGFIHFYYYILGGYFLYIYNENLNAIRQKDQVDLRSTTIQTIFVLQAFLYVHDAWQLLKYLSTPVRLKIWFFHVQEVW